MNSDRIQKDNYDRGIVPAETAARMEREKENYKHTPDSEKEIAGEDELDTTAGYTMDNEGLLNNFAVEPEMYYEVPGDRAQQKAAEEQERREELDEVNDTNKQGELTMEDDKRGHGTGII